MKKIIKKHDIKRHLSAMCSKRGKTPSIVHRYILVFLLLLLLLLLLLISFFLFLFSIFFYWFHVKTHSHSNKCNRARHKYIVLIFIDHAKFKRTTTKTAYLCEIRISLEFYVDNFNFYRKSY